MFLLLWRHQQSIVTSSAEERPREWDTGTILKIVVLSSFMDSLCRVRNKIMYVLDDELFLRSLECYFCVYFPRCFATREINTKITLSWALKQVATRVHILFSMYTPDLIGNVCIRVAGTTNMIHPCIGLVKGAVGFPIPPRLNHDALITHHTTIAA